VRRTEGRNVDILIKSAPPRNSHLLSPTHINILFKKGKKYTRGVPNQNPKKRKDKKQGTKKKEYYFSHPIGFSRALCFFQKCPCAVWILKS